MNEVNVLELAGAIITGLFSVVGILLWANYRDTRSTAEKTKDDLANFKTEVANQHATHGYVDKIFEKTEQFMQAMFKKLDDMQKDMRDYHNDTRDRLDKKQDK